MTNSNPWFWGGLSRWEFERNLQRDAVHLRDKNAKVVVKKVDIEAVKARKNALAAKGVLVSGSTVGKFNASTPTVQNMPRKIK